MQYKYKYIRVMMSPYYDAALDQQVSATPRRNRYYSEYDLTVTHANQALSSGREGETNMEYKMMDHSMKELQKVKRDRTFQRASDYSTVRA